MLGLLMVVRAILKVTLRGRQSHRILSTDISCVVPIAWEGFFPDTREQFQILLVIALGTVGKKIPALYGTGILQGAMSPCVIWPFLRQQSARLCTLRK